MISLSWYTIYCLFGSFCNDLLWFSAALHLHSVHALANLTCCHTPLVIARTLWECASSHNTRSILHSCACSQIWNDWYFRKQNILGVFSQHFVSFLYVSPLFFQSVTRQALVLAEEVLTSKSLTEVLPKSSATCSFLRRILFSSLTVFHFSGIRAKVMIRLSICEPCLRKIWRMNFYSIPLLFAQSLSIYPLLCQCSHH